MNRLIALIFALVLVSGCANTPSQSGKLTIAATFYPLYDLTRAVAGASADVYSVVPINADPHEYQNTPQDLIKLNKADAFVTLGVAKGFAPYEENLIRSAPKNIKIISAGAGISQITPKGEFGDVSSDLNYNGLDPHIWVSPKNAVVMVENIRDGLVRADPANTKLYQENANTLITNLQKVDANFTKGLSNCSKHVILAAHDSFSYLARDYGFKSFYIDGLSPEQEPTPQQIARLIDVAKQYGLKYIFYEISVDPRVSETIASQVGAKTIPLNPAEAANNPNETFVQIMQQNLINLRLALECS
jgi:zinc transport system substrate-binding protein